MPILCATAITGIHITIPFLNLLINTETTYDTRLIEFPKLYNDLTNVKAIDLMQLNHKVCSFASEEMFKSAVPKQCVKSSIELQIGIYPKEIEQLIQVFLPHRDEGFSKQRGAIFGFGPEKDSDTGPLLKICNLDESKRRKLNMAPVHNLYEERSVGFINYELEKV